MPRAQVQVVENGSNGSILSRNADSFGRRHSEAPRFQVDPRLQPGAAQPRGEESRVAGRYVSHSLKHAAQELRRLILACGCYQHAG